MEVNTFIEILRDKFSVNTNLSEITFQQVEVERYNSPEKENKFGEKICLLYRTSFASYNTDVSLKILCLNYETHAEILKLEINIQNELLAREVMACRNFLQRKRNLNLTLEILVKIAKLYETRRLICRTVFERQPHVVISVDDECVNIKCFNSDKKIKFLELSWTIAWNFEELEIGDFIEFSCNDKVLEKDPLGRIRDKLHILVQPTFDFHLKLKLWKSLMTDLYGLCNLKVCNNKTEVLEIIDSDSDESVIEIMDSSEIVSNQTRDEILLVD